MSGPDVPVVIAVPRTTGSSTSIGGDANVTAASGYPLFRNDQIELDVNDNAVVAAIRASGGADGEVRVMEIE